MLDFGAENKFVLLLFDNPSGPHPSAIFDFLRDIGRHFSVNVMIGRESVSRPDGRPMKAASSYTEFS